MLFIVFTFLITFIVVTEIPCKIVYKLVKQWNVFEVGPLANPKIVKTELKLLGEME